jgi:hypothetical protein
VPGAAVEGVSHERAENVYSLLTSFTTGVQRGLDETSSGQAPDDPASEGEPPS